MWEWWDQLNCFSKSYESTIVNYIHIHIYIYIYEQMAKRLQSQVYDKELNTNDNKPIRKR